MSNKIKEKIQKQKIKPVKVTYTTPNGKIHTDKIDEAFILPEKAERVRKAK